jgi:hypothetical protein
VRAKGNQAAPAGKTKAEDGLKPFKKRTVIDTPTKSCLSRMSLNSYQSKKGLI